MGSGIDLRLIPNLQPPGSLELSSLVGPKAAAHWLSPLNPKRLLGVSVHLEYCLGCLNPAQLLREKARARILVVS